MPEKYLGEYWGLERRGVWVLNMKCSRSNSEHTGADFRHIRNIFSRANLLGTHLQICENIVFRDYELLGDRPGPRKYCKKILEILVFTTILIIFRR